MKKVWNFYRDTLGLTVFHPQYFINTYTNQWLSKSHKYLKGNVVDLGCGRMTYRQNLLDMGLKYTGVDHPKIHTLYESPIKPDILADITNIPLPNKTFDTALLIQVLEYLESPAVVIKETARILKSKGYLIIVCPFLYPIHDYPYDQNRLTDTAIRNLLKDNFEVIKLIPQGNLIETISQIFLVGIMKRAQLLLARKNNLEKALGALSLVLGLSLTIPINLIAELLTFLGKNLPNYHNDTPLNWLIIARKK